MASRLPAVGRIRLAPMLNERGHLLGDLTISRLADDRFWIVGSYYLQEWHQRWFVENLPESGVTISNLCDEQVGFSLSGPNARAIMQQLVDIDLSNEAFSFLSCTETHVASLDAMLARISLTGELGYEVTVAAADQPALLRADP